MAKLAVIRASLYVMCCVHSFSACVLILLSADVMSLYQSCTPFLFVSLERGCESLQYSHYGDVRYFHTYSRETSLHQPGSVRRQPFPGLKQPECQIKRLMS